MTLQVSFDDIMDAAKLMGRIYDEKARKKEKIRHSIDTEGVQAYYLADGTLVIPGTNESLDWVDFNLEAFNVIGAGQSMFTTKMGDSGNYEWHAGFLEHAFRVYTFASILQPRLIIGHSLGAASAQIVGSSMGVPTLAFASPRPLRQRRRRRGETKQQPKGAGYVLNLLRSDDLVCDVPPRWLGFTHVGQVVRMNPWGIHLGEDHRINHYMDAMKDRAVKPKLDKKLPATLGDAESVAA